MARLVPGSKEDQLRKSRIAFLYFMEEFIGFRTSLHWFRRYLETGTEEDMEHLFFNVGAENFLNFYDLLDCAEPAKEKTRWLQLRLAVALGMYHYENDSIKFTSGPESVVKTLQKGAQEICESSAPIWELNGWINDNKHNPDLLHTLAWGIERLDNARNNIHELCYFARLLIGRGSLLECMIDSNLTVLSKNAGTTYFPELSNHLTRLANAIDLTQSLNWQDALSRNQIKSKVWLLNKLNEVNWMTPETTTILVGGWLGILPFLADCKQYELGKVINVDIDDTVNKPSAILNSTIEYTVLNDDIRTMEFDKYDDLVIIDTITEHFHDHGSWVKGLPKGTRVVLQGNNMFDVPDHVNCFHNLDEFVEDCGVSNILYYGELNLEKCNRYMVIGEV